MPMTQREESVDSAAVNDEPEQTSCKICDCDTTDWCMHGLNDHKREHFDDINNTLPVRNDSYGARIYKYHDMDFSGYTKYGKCLVLGGLLNSEFPSGAVIHPRDISTLSRIRYLLMSVIMGSDTYNIATIAAERGEIDRLAALLFRNENGLYSMCCQLTRELQ